MSLSFRPATRQDCPLILSFIKELAHYEKMEDQVEATVELLEYWIFDKQCAKVLFLVSEKQTVGFALFFYNFSTFLGRAGLYLEDLYIKEEFRGKGYGQQVFKKIIELAKQEHLGRVEWVCLDWNEPSLAFYKKMKAITLNEWIIHRLVLSEI